MTIRTEIEIPAPAQAVWNVLTDLSAYAAWNPFIRRIEGPLRQGARWHMTLTLDGRLFFPVPIRIETLEPNRHLVWRGGIPGMMTGLHAFNLIEMGGVVRIVQSESFDGLLGPVILPMPKGPLTRRFVEMNEALRAEVARRGRA